MKSTMKKITRTRILNGALLLLPVLLALSYIWLADGENRFWEGKVIGSAIAIVGVLVLISLMILIGKYRETKSWKTAWAMLKDFFLTLLSRDFKKNSKRK